MRRFNHIIALLFAIIIAACKKQDLKWNSQWEAPIADGKIKVSDLLDERYLMVNDSGWYELVFDTTIDLAVDTLLSVKDTTLELTYEVPVSINVPPGVMLINETQNQAAMLPKGFVLKQMNLKSGNLHYRIENYIDGPLRCKYNIQRASINGLPLEINVEVNGANVTTPGVVEGDFDLSNAIIDLTGVTGFLVNDLATTMQIYASNSLTQNIPVSAGDHVVITVSFENPVVSYAKGYFGQEQLHIDETFSLGENFPNGEFHLKALDWKCQFQNWMGVDLKMAFHSFEVNKTGKETLNIGGPGLGDVITLARAEDWQGAVNPQLIDWHWNNQNSNLLELTNYMGGQAHISADLQLNPLGNNNGTNDFIYPEKMFSIHSHIQSPLCFNAKLIHAEEWVALDWDNNVDWNGKLKVQLENAFPFDAALTFIHESEVIGVVRLNPGGWDASNNTVITDLCISELTLTSAQWEGIKKNGGFRVEWVFNTTNYPGFVCLRPEQYAAVKVIGNVNVQTTIQ